MKTAEKGRNAAGILWLQIAVIAFWAVTTSILVKRSWFSEESGMVKVGPEKVFEMFFAWTEGAELTILKDGRRVGQMSLSAQVEKNSSTDDGEAGEVKREISVAGSLQELSSQGKGEKQNRDEEIYWRGVMAMDDGLIFPKGDFVLRMPNAGVGIQFGFDQPANTIALIVRSGSERLINYHGNPAGLTKLPKLGWLGRFLPLDSLLGSQGLSEGMLETWAPEIDGRFGNVTIAGRRMLVYQLIFRRKSSRGKAGTETKLYLSETGEPLMIQTGWGYEALADVLVPLEVYEESYKASH